MRVSLISYTKQAEQVVASAAKLCYSPSAIDGILEGLTPEKTAGFVEMLAEIGHESPIEHACFTFGIEGVSRSLLAQITRHRIASYSVQSQRYVREVQFEYVTPPEIAADKQALTVYKAAMSAAQESYDRLSDLLKKTHKARLIAGGLDPKRADRDAEKLAIEDARFTLPNACVTKMVVTMNARSLLNFFSHRCCNRAQWEIRDLADKMLAMCVSVAPNLFKAAGPPCVRGKCAEGKMSCGKQAEVFERINALKRMTVENRE